MRGRRLVRGQKPVSVVDEVGEDVVARWASVVVEGDEVVEAVVGEEVDEAGQEGGAEEVEKRPDLAWN